MMIIGILPTIDATHLRAESFSANPRYALLNEQVFAARGRGPRDLDRRRRAAIDPRRHDRAGGRVHERSAPPAGRARGVRSLLERGAGDRRRAGRGGGELAVLLRQGAVAGDPDRVVRAGDRHASGGAEDPGRASARVVRRALDHLDLRPVRGERAATSRRCCPCATRRIRSRRSSAATSRSSASCASTTARSTAGTARSTTSCATSRTCASRTGCCRRARRSSTSWPTPRSTTGCCG